MRWWSFAVALLYMSLGVPAVAGQSNAPTESPAAAEKTSATEKPAPAPADKPALPGLFGSGFIPDSGTMQPAIANSIRRKWQANVQAEPHGEWSGTTILECDVKRDGKLGKIKVTQSSGNKALDENAKSAVESAAPFAKLPADFQGSRFRALFAYNLPSTDERPACSALQLPTYPRLRRSMRQPRAIDSPNPEYSDEARKLHYQATIVVNLTVTPDGKPKEVCLNEVVGLGLDEKAVAAVRQWKFEPAMENGTPVAVRLSTEVNYRLH